ncbi:hypothetical protein [Nocardia wallacei]|uniref:hypothetical protein n=1 Tax=Nocardia wallacei TaxID=480035 RepID=UPI002457FD0D|nr:hypothetical protein [Nocardia wallacei]
MTISDSIARLEAGMAVCEQRARAALVLAELADTITTSSCDEFAEHIVRQDPKRTLRRLDTYRELIAQRSATVYGLTRLRDLLGPDNPYRRFHEGRLDALDQAIEALAGIYTEDCDHDSA